jgi:hypothetical protein
MEKVTRALSALEHRWLAPSSAHERRREQGRHRERDKGQDVRSRRLFCFDLEFSLKFPYTAAHGLDVGCSAELSTIMLRRRQALLRHSRTQANTLPHVSIADWATVLVAPCSLLLCQRTCLASLLSWWRHYAIINTWYTMFFLKNKSRYTIEYSSPDLRSKFNHPNTSSW